MPTKNSVLITAMSAALVLGVTGCGGESSDTRGRAKSSSASGKKESGQDKEPTREQAGGKAAPSGVQKLAPKEILKESVKAMKEAGTWRVTVNGGDLGTADITTDTSGNCAGTFTNEGTTFQILKKKDKVWLKPEDAYWDLPEVKKVLAEIPEAKGKYLHGTTQSAFTLAIAAVPCMIGDLANVEKFANSTSAAGKGPVTTVDGQKAVPVQAEDSEDGKGDKKASKVTFFVATEGRPYLLKLDSDEGSDAGSGASATMGALELSDFGMTFAVPPTPSAAESIDAAKVEQASFGASG
ncbi:hypothetical protein ACFZAV_42915 [Streptomyces sp. NPDC008343]|uniref:hypothetical protein n=1 Tax=Streptomyces sp. NPDC008343 TaxID=3364828 RepID=UPI0036F01416